MNVNEKVYTIDEVVTPFTLRIDALKDQSLGKYNRNGYLK